MKNINHLLKNKLMSILGGVVIIISLISFFFLDVPSFFKEWYYSIYITPKTISVDKSNWAIKKSVQIVNNNPYPIYAVQLKISEVTQNSNIDDIEIKPQSYIINTNFSSSTDMNAFIISGYSKINDKKWKRSIIYKIDSHSQIDIQLTIPPPSAQEEFKLEITDFSKEARDILENQQNATRVDFQIKN